MPLTIWENTPEEKAQRVLDRNKRAREAALERKSRKEGERNYKIPLIGFVRYMNDYDQIERDPLRDTFQAMWHGGWAIATIAGYFLLK